MPILFSASNRSSGRTLEVKFEKAQVGRKLRDGFIALNITLKTKAGDKKEYKMWDAKVKEANRRAEMEKSIAASQNERVKPQF